MGDRLISETVSMSLTFVAYVAIPDSGILEAQDFAERACAQLGGSCDWQFHDSERVVYWFTGVDAWRAFQSYCVIRDWTVG